MNDDREICSCVIYCRHLLLLELRPSLSSSSHVISKRSVSLFPNMKYVYVQRVLTGLAKLFGGQEIKLIN